MSSSDLAIDRSGRSGGQQIAKITRGLGALLSIGIALFSYRYLMGLGPVPENISQNALKNPWLVIHVVGAATALLIGPFQFISRLRSHSLHIHRWLGRIYGVGCTVGGIAGLILAFGASTGPISVAGFGLLAAAWLIATTLGWLFAMQRQFARHRTWMIRSFALTLAAVTLRIYLGILVISPIPFIDGYRAISFLCWVPNLLAAELYLTFQRSRSHKRRPISGSLLTE